MHEPESVLGGRVVSRLLELDAYVTGEMADVDAFEEAMFDAPDDPDLTFLDNVQRHGARLAEHGTFDMARCYSY